MRMTFFEMNKLVQVVSYKPGWSIDIKVSGYHPQYHDKPACFHLSDDMRPYIQVYADETTEASVCPFTFPLVTPLPIYLLHLGFFLYWLKTAR